MSEDPTRWENVFPGNFDKRFAEVAADDAGRAVDRASGVFFDWRNMPLDDRKQALTRCREALAESKEMLALLIAEEVGKPLREARLELDAVVAKFGFAFQDADWHLADREVTDGPHPALVRSRPMGPAAVIAPFNFPIHLGHGAALAYLLAGSPVLFKPSPLAANIAAAYGKIMNQFLPPCVFQIVQGWGATARAICLDARVRAVCFTGSLPVGLSLAKDLASDFSKSLALELGGKNCLMICDDADLPAAALAAADGLCLTTGQRCNATSRILVHHAVEADFLELFRAALTKYVPGDPTKEETLLGPLANRRAFDRYQLLVSTPGDWLIAGASDDSSGYYVRPAVLKTDNPMALGSEEFFSPVATWESFATTKEAISLQKNDVLGLTASIFTSSDAVFADFARELEVGNLYRNLPTTFSPSSLPFGGLLRSGNGKPGGRGFARFAAHEQAVQWRS
ncbi:MAG: aldehyde dehydrogenase family protein [Terrimicrobiaceae bacterium]